MPGNYNHWWSSQQTNLAFSKIMVDYLKKYNIPFAINADTQFYDRFNHNWIWGEKWEILDLILRKYYK